MSTIFVSTLLLKFILTNFYHLKLKFLKVKAVVNVSVFPGKCKSWIFTASLQKVSLM